MSSTTMKLMDRKYKKIHDNVISHEIYFGNGKYHRQENAFI
jgi:hypothetical protein